MPGEVIGGILELVLQLLPHLLKTELEKINEKIDEIQKERNKDEQDALKAMESNDFDALNRIIAKLLHGLR
jgi:galactose-1-phosphate uridylyltransferase